MLRTKDRKPKLDHSFTHQIMTESPLVPNNCEHRCENCLCGAHNLLQEKGKGQLGRDEVVYRGYRKLSSKEEGALWKEPPSKEGKPKKLHLN